jgi:hypothetical protein
MASTLPAVVSRAAQLGVLLALVPHAIAQSVPALRVQGDDTLADRGFTAELADGEGLGSAVARLGDVDGDGIDDLGIGSQAAASDFDEAERGRLRILFLAEDGRIDAISPPLRGSAAFGTGGIVDLGERRETVGPKRPHRCLAVGAPAHGAVSILELASDRSGTVLRHTLIEAPVGAPKGFGSGLAWFPNQDGGGTLAIGATGDAGSGPGDVFFVALDAKLAARGAPSSLRHDHGFSATLDAEDGFGVALATGDLDADGLPDLVVGAHGARSLRRNAPSSGTSAFTGACFVLTLDAALRVRGTTRLDPRSAGFNAAAPDNALFGAALAVLGDLDRDGRPELCVGAPGWHDPGLLGHGVVHAVELARDPLTPSQVVIASAQAIHEGVLGGTSGSTFGGVRARIAMLGGFGRALASVPDSDADGHVELFVGAPLTRSAGEALLVDLSPESLTHAHVQRYGNGCAGPGGELTLEATGGLPVVGNDRFALRVTNVPSAATVVLELGFVPATLDLGGFGAPGCALLLEPLASVVHRFGYASVDFAMPIPPIPELADGPALLAQAVLVAPRANALGITTSNALAVGIGR